MDKNNEKKPKDFEELLIEGMYKELTSMFDEMFVPIATSKEVTKEDMINHPPHYNFGKFECLEVIEDILGKEGYAAYLKGNIMKYLWRADKKNGAEDLKKAQFYLDKLIRL